MKILYWQAGCDQRLRQVSDGDAANQSTFNNAFMSRTASTTSTVAKITLSNAVSDSGSAIVNTQREFNALSSYTGKAINLSKTALPAWTSTAVGASGDNLTQRAEALTAKFDTGALILNSSQTIQGEKIFTGGVQLNGYLSASASNYAGSGSSVRIPTPTTPIVRLTNSSLSSISYVTPPAASAYNQLLLLLNYSGSTVQINDNNAASGGIRNGTNTGAPINLSTNKGALMAYDKATDRWYLYGGAGSSSSGGGGGNYVVRGVDGSAPIESYTYGYKEFEFEKATAQSVRFGFTVPASFFTTTSYKINGKMRCPSGSGDIVMTTNVQLYRSGHDPSSPYDETGDFDTTVSSVGVNVKAFSISMPNANGYVGADRQFNAGDWIVVTMTRKVSSGSDTATGTMYLTSEAFEMEEV